LPRYLAQRFIDSGALVEKQVLAQSSNESVWMGWNEQTAGLASAWWRDEILANSAIALFISGKRREISQLERKLPGALQSIAFCIRCGAKCRRCNQMNNRRFKRRRLFFCMYETKLKTKRPGFVPDRYLLKSDSCCR
jgi:hypothetical protein